MRACDAVAYEGMDFLFVLGVLSGSGVFSE